jgi:hypothetical protein
VSGPIFDRFGMHIRGCPCVRCQIGDVPSEKLRANAVIWAAQARERAKRVQKQVEIRERNERLSRATDERLRREREAEPPPYTEDELRDLQRAREEFRRKMQGGKAR